MANKPDRRGDFLLDDTVTDYPTVTEEVDTAESPSDRASSSDRSSASTATDEHGSFLLRDRFSGQGPD